MTQLNVLQYNLKASYKCQNTKLLFTIIFNFWCNSYARNGELLEQKKEDLLMIAFAQMVSQISSGNWILGWLRILNKF